MAERSLQIFYTGFDKAFLKLPVQVRARIEAKIDEMGLRLAMFPHHRLLAAIGIGFVSVTIASFTRLKPLLA